VIPVWLIFPDPAVVLPPAWHCVHAIDPTGMWFAGSAVIPVVNDTVEV
jgi:hypothetical protein